MAKQFRNYLNAKLADPAYAKAFGAEAVKADFAMTLLDARQREGLTQDDLADLVGCSQSYIAQLERGDANPTLGKAGEIMAAMKLSLRTSSSPLIRAAHVSDVWVECTFVQARTSFESTNQAARTEPSYIVLWPSPHQRTNAFAAETQSKEEALV